jgi:Fic family protein
MNYNLPLYIWQRDAWPQWRFSAATLLDCLTRASHLQGLLLGRLADMGLSPRDTAQLHALTQDVLKSSEIEGESFDLSAVRSSVARRLGVDIGALAPVDRRVEGIVAMVLDASTHFDQRLTEKRLFAWHAALFPTGFSVLSQIKVGGYRDDTLGPMQVVSGSMRRQVVHFEAPPAVLLQQEMKAFLHWVNHEKNLHPILKAGIGHLWFVTIHPFDDGNGRIARAIGDLLLARADGSPQRFYSLSAQIQLDRKNYYLQLQRAQQGELDVTDWLMWFLTMLEKALQAALHSLDAVLFKTRCWQAWAGLTLNERQVKVLNRLLDGFEGVLNTSKWAALAKCSPDTALRDITVLLDLGVLAKSASGGRSTSYVIVDRGGA